MCTYMCSALLMIDETVNRSSAPIQNIKHLVKHYLEKECM